jgi:DNA (cytosine-5)-methyltransferase 1
MNELANQQSLNELALFAGAGGGILGGKLLGWRTVCAVEWEPYPASVLVARQNDGLLPPFPIWDDVQTFDGKPWRGIVDVVSGGFPCQDISSAGRGAGIDGERSGMWREMARIIHEVQPRFAFVENSPMLTSRGLGTVLGDLASMGFDARWGVLGAADVGANHQRDRIWIVGKMANSKKLFGNGSNNNSRISLERKEKSKFGDNCWEKNVSNPNLSQQQRGSFPSGIQQENSYACDPCWWEIEPDLGRVADGVASRVDRLKAIGNGQVPLCAATAWRILSG